MRSAALALVALLAACSIPDPEDLQGYSDFCRVNESCADDFACEDHRCVLLPGFDCREGFDGTRCPLQQGVCAGARHACVGGKVEFACTEASYGPDWEPVETRCGDGLDNDCDGRVDAAPGDGGTPNPCG